MLGRIACLLCFGLALVFGYIFFAGYVLREDCFNELGRCFDEETGIVTSQQAGMVWFALALLALAAGLVLAWRWIKPKG